jgi:hypothetical protein
MSDVQWPTGQTEVVDSSEAVAETQEQFYARRDAEIKGWLEAKAALDASKAAEAERRAQVTKTLFPTPKKGTQRYALNGGYNVKLVHGWNYTLGDKDKCDESGLKIPVAQQIAELENRLAEIEGVGEMLAERLIRWKPELVATEYEKLNLSTASEGEIAAKTLIDDYLQVSEASPQLAFEEPKAK